MKTENNIEIEVETLVFHKINHDINGNPRFLVDYSNLLTNEELQKMQGFKVNFEIAKSRARCIDGSAYRGKSYRGGIVFCSYNVDNTADDISRVTGRKFKAER